MAGPRPTILFLGDRSPTTSQTFINNQILSLLARGAGVTVLTFGTDPDAVGHVSSRRILDQVRLIVVPPPRNGWRGLMALPAVLTGRVARHARSLRSVGRLRSLGSYHLQAVHTAGRLVGRLNGDYIFAHFGP